MNRRDIIVYTALVLFLVVDTALTYLMWGAEGNPIVTALGPEGWLLLKVVLSIGIGWVWYAAKPHPSGYLPIWMQEMIRYFMFGAVIVFFAIYFSVVSINISQFL